MFDIGWTELLVLGAIALIVVGPQDLPGMLRRLGQFAGQAKRMARDFQRTLEDAADHSDLKDLHDVRRSMSDWNSKIGANAPRKYAESLLKGEDGEKTSAAPAPGSHDAADAAENAAWQAEQARAAPPAASGGAAGAQAPRPAPDPGAASAQGSGSESGSASGPASGSAGAGGTSSGSEPGDPSASRSA